MRKIDEEYLNDKQSESYSMQAKKRYAPEFKAKVALEAIEPQASVSAIAEKYQISKSLVYEWRNKLIQEAAVIFDERRATRMTYTVNRDVI
jgi:transposase-like protein